MKKTIPPKVKEKLSSALQNINRIPSINGGGCGVVARQVFTTLRKQGIKAEINMVSYGGGNDIPKVSEAVINKNLDNNTTDWSHVVVTVGNNVIDSTGIHSRQKFPYRHGSVVPVNIPAGVYDLFHSKAGWNPNYSTRNNKLVKVFLDGAFK